MKLPRWLQLRILWILNELLPPRLRDARWFVVLPMRLVLGSYAELVMNFRERAYSMTDAEFYRVYEEIGTVSLTRGSDLNRPCLERILDDVVGDSVLEVGCGEGALAIAMSRTHSVTACDLVLNNELVRENPQITFREADVERLPFPHDQFDTVVCTHTLEHVRDLLRSVSELRRVARRRLIVVVPMERPYRYTFNLHLHFFPYPHSLQAAMGLTLDAECCELGGDLYYMEDVASVAIDLREPAAQPATKPLPA